MFKIRKALLLVACFTCLNGSEKEDAFKNSSSLSSSLKPAITSTSSSVDTNATNTSKECKVSSESFMEQAATELGKIADNLPRQLQGLDCFCDIEGCERPSYKVLNSMAFKALLNPEFSKQEKLSNIHGDFQRNVRKLIIKSMIEDDKVDPNNIKDGFHHPFVDCILSDNMEFAKYLLARGATFEESKWPFFFRDTWYKENETAQMIYKAMNVKDASTVSHSQSSSNSNFSK